MASNRFILPNSADTSCELWLEGSKIEIKFFSSDGKALGSKSFLMVSISDEDIVNHLASSEVNFTTFSALYDGATLILNNAQGLKGSESERKVVLRRKKEDEKESSKEKEKKEDLSKQAVISESGVQPLSFETKDLGTLIHHFEISYTKNIIIYIFQITRLSYSIVIEKDNEKVYQGDLRKIPDENDIYPLLQESQLQDLESMTVMFEVSEIIVKACNSAVEYARNLPDEIKERVELSRDLTEYLKAKKAEAEAKEETDEKSEAGRLEDSDDTKSDDKEEPLPVKGQYLLEFKVPYSASSVDFYLSDKEIIAVFKKENNEESRINIVGIPTEDEAYSLVDNSGITDTFSSMSLIYDVIEKIVDVCTDPQKFVPVEEEETEEEVNKVITDSKSATQVFETESEVVEDDEEKAGFRKIVESGTFVTELKIPYSHETSVNIYWDEDTNDFTLQFKRGEKEVDLMGTNNKLDEDGAWEIFNGANIEFISMSVIYDAAEDIIKIVQDPEGYIKQEAVKDIDDESFEGFEREKEEDLPVDFDQFKKAEDIEPLLQEIKKILAKSNKPIQVMEQQIKTMPKVGFKVFRQGEVWSLDFYSLKDGKILSQRPAKLKSITSDEVFKAVNNGIPQVTLSAVSDASEYIFDIIKHLAERPADDLAFNQVVNHFEKIISTHEESDEINEAIKLTEGLMYRLETLGNPGGVAKFGLRLAKFFESQDKIADSSKHRLDLIPKLVKMNDLQALREFVDDTIELFVTSANRPLDAAQVSVDFAEVIVRRKDLLLAMKYIKEASLYFKEANILRALADHNFRFAKLYLQLLRGDESEGFFKEIESKIDGGKASEDSTVSDLVKNSIDPFADLGEDPFADIDSDEEPIDEKSSETQSADLKEEIDITKSLPDPLELFDFKEKSLQSLLADTEVMFKGTLEVLDETNEHVEYLDTLTEIILLYRRYEFLTQEIIFGDLGVSALKNSGQKDRALRLSLQLMDKLLVKDGDITKGLDFFNEAVKLYYDKQQWKQALDLAMSSIPKLISFADSDTAIQYVNFGLTMVDRVFSPTDEKTIPYYLELSKFFTNLKKQNESLDVLSKAINLKKKELSELLEFCHQYSLIYLKKKEWNTARDFINSSLNVIGTSDYPTIFKVAYQFFKDLSSHNNFQMANEYLTYAYQLTGQLTDPLESAGKLVINAINHYLIIEEADMKENISPLLPILKAYVSKTQKFGEIKDILEPVIQKFLENENYDEAIENTRDLSIYLRHGKDFVAAGEILHKVRNKVIDKVSKEIIREFTDNAIKLSVDETAFGQKRGIDILEPIIPYLIDNGEFSDAYLYTVQTVKYFETQNQQKEANSFIKAMRELFENKNRDQDVNSLTDLMIRLSKPNALEEAAVISYEAYKNNLDKEGWEASYGYLTDSANTFVKLNNKSKANDLLTEGYNVFLKHPEAEEEADEIINEIVKFRKVVKKWKDKDVLEFYKKSIKIALEHDNIKLLNKTITKMISLIKSKFKQAFYDEMSEIINTLLDAGLFKESHPYVSDLLLSHMKDLNYARELLFYYVTAYIKGNEVEIAQKIVELVLEKSKSDSGNIIRITMRFVQLLAEYRLSGQARAYIDKIVSNLFPTTMMNQTQSTAVATIYDKFASMVIKGSPELAIEYGYKAADLYRKVHNLDKFIEIYKLLSSEIEEGETVRSILRRGANQAEQLKIPFKKQLFILTTLVLKGFETKSPNVGREFLQVLSQLEKENMLKETLAFLQDSFFRMVRINEFDLFYRYIEYLKTLSDGLKTETPGIKILVQLAARYYNKKKDKTKVKKLKQIYDSFTHEPNPPDELLAYFLKTGEITLPEPVVKEIEIEVREAIPIISSDTVDSDTIKAMEEVEASASSLEDELSELGGDELSQALADAISQLSSDVEFDDEIDYSQDIKKEDTDVSKVLSQESTSSMDLAEFDSLKEIKEQKLDTDTSTSLPSISPEDTKSLENIFSSALSDLTEAFGMADLEAETGTDDSDSVNDQVTRSDTLTKEEEKIYLEINKEYTKIMKGKDFYTALEDWKAKLPNLLKQFGISVEKWEEISEKGDKDEELSDIINK